MTSDGLPHQVCVGKCVVHWLTQFNPYDGNAVSTSSAALTVPDGLGAGCPANCPPDLRQGGDWYVGVQVRGPLIAADCL